MEKQAQDQTRELLVQQYINTSLSLLRSRSRGYPCKGSLGGNGQALVPAAAIDRTEVNLKD